MPQLNPEFFVSQLFWLVVTFCFLLIFLWKISLPRIGSVLQKREDKISEDIENGKKLQAEAEEIEQQINNQLLSAKTEASTLIKKTLIELQKKSNEELDNLDKNLNKKIEESSQKIEKNKKDSLNEINDQIISITKLTLSKVSDIKINDNEIESIINNNSEKRILN